MRQMVDAILRQYGTFMIVRYSDDGRILAARAFFQPVRSKNWQNTAYMATPLGEITTKLMIDSFPDIVDYKFTAQMEDKLDSGETKSDDLNAIIHKTVSLIEKYDDEIIMDFPLVVDEYGRIVFSTEISERTKLRFLKDIYGTEELDTEEQKLSESTAQEVFDFLCGEIKYNIDMELYTEVDALKIAMIRFNLSLNAYQKYITTTI